MIKYYSWAISLRHDGPTRVRAFKGITTGNKTQKRVYITDTWGNWA